MMPSSPGPTARAGSASSRAALPELTAAAAETPSRCASSRSSPATSGPCASWPPRTTRATRSASSSLSVGREWGMMRSAPAITSEIQEQSDRLEGLRELDSRLDAAEVRARPRQLQDRQVLDVGLRHLGFVRREPAQLRLEHVGDVGGAVRHEV